MRLTDKLNDTDVFNLLQELGAEPIDIGNAIQCKTICHCGDSHKLFFYKSTKLFRCYTQCDTLNIYELVMHVHNCDFKDAASFLNRFFNFRFEEEHNVFTFEFFNKFEKQELKYEIKMYDKNILNTYYPFYHQLWINDNISPLAMQKFNIRFSILDNQIVIPHFDINNNLIGIRARNLNKSLVDAGKKYMPVFYNNKVLKHATGATLYGLNVSKDNIKKYRTVIIFESEKSVMQYYSYFPDDCIAVALCGSSITPAQIDELITLGVDTVIVAADKDFEENGTLDEEINIKKINQLIVLKLINLFNVQVIFDRRGLLSLHDSPTDRGKEIFEKLLNDRIYVRR